jgi:chorismate dehydratase
VYSNRVHKNFCFFATNIEELKKIKIGAVSYLNTKPLLYGIQRSNILQQQIELIEDYPSNIAKQLLEGTIDVGLVPVAIIPNLAEWHIISDFCIGAEGEVASVCLFSEVPLEQIETVLLDYQSKTSVNLCKILFQHYWKKTPQFLQAGINYRNEIKGTTAGVIIGDRALEQQHISAYVFDLAAAWKSMTGLPFVFAAWIANKTLPNHFIEEFNKANEAGLHHLQEIVNSLHYPHYDLLTYYTKNISFYLSDDKRKGMNLFLEMLNDLEKNKS